jgi:hypothetical protein
VAFVLLVLKLLAVGIVLLDVEAVVVLVDTVDEED